MMTTTDLTTIRPQGRRFAAQMNAAARLRLAWDSDLKCWTTTDADAVAQMVRLGAEVAE